MFGWRRKNDGFVWHEYVRTTILVRREQRRQKIEDIRVGAVDGLKNAGRQGVELGISGASAAGRGIANGAVAAFYTTSDWIVVAATATRLWFADRIAGIELHWQMSPLAPAARAFGARWTSAVREPAVATPVLLIGGVCALSAIARWRDHGFDLEGTITSTIALTSFLAVGLPRLVTLASGHGLTFGTGSRPWTAGMRPELASALRLGAMLVAAVALFGWLVPALTSGVTLTPQASGGKPLLVPASGRIEGKATVVAGDQLRVGPTLVRLFGIEAPEAGQTCAGPGGKSASCGANAKAALQRLIAGKQVACELSAASANAAAASATCRINGADIAGQLVRGGHVFAQTGLFATYASAEREASSARAGLWRGDAVRPAQYRAKVWDDAKAGSPDGCPIKAIIAGEAKTYLLPWSSSYDRTKIKPARGERWFCTESEARSAGWKLAEGG